MLTLAPTRNKEDEEEKPIRRKSKNPKLAAMAAAKILGRKLQKEHGDEIKYYFLAGDSYTQIAKELGIAETYCGGHNNVALEAVGKAIRG